MHLIAFGFLSEKVPMYIGILGCCFTEELIHLFSCDFSLVRDAADAFDIWRLLYHKLLRLDILRLLFCRTEV